MKKGGGFEAIVAQELRSAGLAIRKVDPPFKVLRFMGRGQYLGHFESSGALDFAGCVDRRHVEFDAKDIKGSRFDFSRIRTEQMEWANALRLEHALVGWLVRFRMPNSDNDQVWFIMHQMLLNLLENGHKSASLKVLQEAIGGNLVWKFPPIFFGRHLARMFRENA